MEMSMMHAGLAAGAALAALPVILHLFMRQTPKHVIFPALRLIKERQKQSKKRMRIKNWLLLLGANGSGGTDGACACETFALLAGSTRCRIAADGAWPGV